MKFWRAYYIAVIWNWFRLRFLILKARLGLSLTSDERSEYAYWITRNVKTPTSEALSREEDSIDLEHISSLEELFEELEKE